MDSDIQARLDAQDEYLKAIFNSVEKMRKYFQWTFIIIVVTFVLPLIGLIFAIPAFIGSYTSALAL